MKKTIAWEKWKDPFEVHVEDDDDNDFNAYEHKKTGRNMRAVVTSMGVMPITEYNTPGKTFSFWIGHTNFSITKDIHKLIGDIEGVETFDIFTRYRFRVGIGKLFDETSVKKMIDKGLAEYHVAKDKNIDIKELSGSTSPNIKDLLRGVYGKKT